MLQTIARDNGTYDAIVVGSGATGGVAAWQLAAAGLKVCVLEAGPKITDADFTEHVLPYDLKYRGNSVPVRRGRSEVAGVDAQPAHSGPRVRLPRVELQVVRGRHQESLPDARRTALPLDPDEGPGRPLPFLGPAVLSDGRYRFPVCGPGRVRRELGHRVRRSRPVLREGGALHRTLRPRRRTGPAAGQRLHARHAVHLRGGPVPEAAALLHGTGSDDRTSGGPHRAPERSRSLPLLRTVRAGVRHPLLLQQPHDHPQGRGGQRQLRPAHRCRGEPCDPRRAHRQGVRHRLRGSHRPEHPARSAARSWCSARRRWSRRGS